MAFSKKVSLLKKTDIFKNTPEEDLVGIADILEEVSLKTGQTIFSKNEIGDCMYIVKQGSVRIHDGAYTFAILNENEVLANSLYWILKPGQRPLPVTQIPFSSNWVNYLFIKYYPKTRKC